MYIISDRNFTDIKFWQNIWPFVTISDHRYLNHIFFCYMALLSCYRDCTIRFRPKMSGDQLHSMWTAALILWKKYSRTYSFPLGNFFGKNILTIFIKLRGEICRLQATPKNNGDGCSLTKWPVFEASSKHSLMILYVDWGTRYYIGHMV